jgi:hypothetical protein
MAGVTPVEDRPSRPPTSALSLQVLSKQVERLGCHDGLLRRVFGFFVKVLGSAMLGFATIFTPKAKPDGHWSTPVNLAIEDTGGSEATGAKPAGDLDAPRRRGARKKVHHRSGNASK